MSVVLKGWTLKNSLKVRLLNIIAGVMRVYFAPLQQNLSAATAARVVQLDKHRSAAQKATGSNSRETNTLGPYITEEKVLPL